MTPETKERHTISALRTLDRLNRARKRPSWHKVCKSAGVPANQFGQELRQFLTTGGYIQDHNLYAISELTITKSGRQLLKQLTFTGEIDPLPDHKPKRPPSRL